MRVDHDNRKGTQAAQLGSKPQCMECACLPGMSQATAHVYLKTIPYMQWADLLHMCRVVRGTPILHDTR